jgi:glycosyltransferase involved in cell wall biosynthesis
MFRGRSPRIGKTRIFPVVGMTKTVAIDARWLVGGIGTYTENLLKGLGSRANGLEIQAITGQANVRHVRELCSRVTVVDAPIYTVSEQWLIPRAARSCDLLHVPHYNIPVLYRRPLVVSIMDVIHLRSPEYRDSLRSRLYARPMLAAAARRAEHIITVSHYSKTQIVEVLGAAASKVSVIHCGVDARFRPNGRGQECRSAAAGLGIRTPYLLYVGNLKPHKNVATLLRAFAGLRSARKIEHSLLIVGDDARWKHSVVEECSRLHILDCTVFAPYISAELLQKIYAGAELLVMPSRVEGFGLPVLEAMACGTPVLCSNAASLPEVAGDAAVFFDPASHEELAFQILRILQSSELRESLSALGPHRAKKFNWQVSAGKHAEIYSQLLGMN